MRGRNAALPFSPVSVGRSVACWHAARASEAPSKHGCSDSGCLGPTRRRPPIPSWHTCPPFPGGRSFWPRSLQSYAPGSRRLREGTCHGLVGPGNVCSGSTPLGSLSSLSPTSPSPAEQGSAPCLPCAFNSWTLSLFCLCAYVIPSNLLVWTSHITRHNDFSSFPWILSPLSDLDVFSACR